MSEIDNRHLALEAQKLAGIARQMGAKRVDFNHRGYGDVFLLNDEPGGAFGDWFHLEQARMAELGLRLSLQKGSDMPATLILGREGQEVRALLDDEAKSTPDILRRQVDDLLSALDQKRH